MHEAIAAVWALPTKTVSIITKTLDQAVAAYFVRSLLPIHDKTAILVELKRDLPKVASELVEHFSATGTISSERWVETNFSATFAGQDLNLRLHGKLDALVETEKEVAVYDYKTKTGMSLRAIKGETQNSDGGYFRQLVFYRLLLMDNPSFRTKMINPALVFVKPDDKGRCPIVTVPIEVTDIDRVKQEIQLLIDQVWSGQLFNQTCDDPACEFCHWRDLMFN
jgi:hypothetical protein